MLEYQKRTSAMATATHRGPIYKSGGQLDVTWSRVENSETTTTTYLLTKDIPQYSRFATEKVNHFIYFLFVSFWLFASTFMPLS